MIRTQPPKSSVVATGQIDHLTALAVELYVHPEPGWHVPVAVGHRLLEDSAAAAAKTRANTRDPNIPHVFVLGQPMIPRTGEYASDEPKWDRDMARLREISAEYRSRLQAEEEAEQQRIDPDAKVAHVIYSTG